MSDADDDSWVSVLTLACTVTCAGADLKAISSGQAAGLNTKRGGFAGLVRREREKPIIAAVDGRAFAGGCEIALACDLIVASSAAAFGIPEARRSLCAAGAGLSRLPHAVPTKVALELALTGEPSSAQRAYDLGLVNELCEAGQAVDTAVALAERICVNAPLAVRESRKV